MPYNVPQLHKPLYLVCTMHICHTNMYNCPILYPEILHVGINFCPKITQDFKHPCLPFFLFLFFFKKCIFQGTSFF
jgi:hypothetical protein